VFIRGKENRWERRRRVAVMTLKATIEQRFLHVNLEWREEPGEENEFKRAMTHRSTSREIVQLVRLQNLSV